MVSSSPHVPPIAVNDPDVISYQQESKRLAPQDAAYGRSSILKGVGVGFTIGAVGLATMVLTGVNPALLATVEFLGAATAATVVLSASVMGIKKAYHSIRISRMRKRQAKITERLAKKVVDHHDFMALTPDQMKSHIDYNHGLGHAAKVERIKGQNGLKTYKAEVRDQFNEQVYRIAEQTAKTIAPTDRYLVGDLRRSVNDELLKRQSTLDY